MAEALTNADPYIEGQDQGHVKINELHRRGAVGPSLRVEDRDENDADALTPSLGQSWLVAPGAASGDLFFGHDNEIATWWGAYYFRPLLEGEVFSILDEKIVVVVGSGGAADLETIHTWT